MQRQRLVRSGTGGIVGVGERFWGRRGTGRRKMTDFERKVECLKVWYAIFTTIIDRPESPQEDIKKLRQLRDRIRKEAPDIAEVEEL
jgi:hypothetical protein